MERERRSCVVFDEKEDIDAGMFPKGVPHAERAELPRANRAELAKGAGTLPACRALGLIQTCARRKNADAALRGATFPDPDKGNKDVFINHDVLRKARA